MDIPTLILEATERLHKRSGESSKFEARLLLGLALGTNEPVYPHMHVAIKKEQIERYQELIGERMTGKPISRIRGWREFWSLPFKLNHATLDPRPESELLVEKAIFYARSNFFSKIEKPHLLDLGTGSGCLLLASLNELEYATGVGVDIDKQAICQAQENACLLQLQQRSEFFISNWFERIANTSFDIILCNPPYISFEEEKYLQDEVLSFDPRHALFSDKNGLADYEVIFSKLASYLSPHGIVSLEIGYNQLKSVSEIAQHASLRVCNVFEDLQGIPRCLILCHSRNTVL